jgi:hypothetical protein
VARGVGFRRGEMGGLEVLCLVDREYLLRSCGAPLVLDSRRKIVPEDVVTFFGWS